MTLTLMVLAILGLLVSSHVEPPRVEDPAKAGN
jgi:hypothetical protein